MKARALLWIISVASLMGAVLLWFSALATETVAATSGVSLADPDDIQRAEWDKTFAKKLEKELAEHDTIATQAEADASCYRLFAFLLSATGIASGTFAWRRRSRTPSPIPTAYDG